MVGLNRFYAGAKAVVKKAASLGRKPKVASIKLDKVASEELSQIFSRNKKLMEAMKDMGGTVVGKFDEASNKVIWC